MEVTGLLKPSAGYRSQTTRERLLSVSTIVDRFLYPTCSSSMQISGLTMWYRKTGTIPGGLAAGSALRP